MIQKKVPTFKEIEVQYCPYCNCEPYIESFLEKDEFTGEYKPTVKYDANCPGCGLSASLKIWNKLAMK